MRLTPASDVKRLLIVKLSSIGDVIHALPIVRSLKEQRPDMTLGWVVKKRCADLLRGNPNIDRLFIVPDRPQASDLLRLSGELRRENYDVALDMQGLMMSGLITRLSGAPRRIGLDRNREGNSFFLTDAVVPGRDPMRHAMDILNGFTTELGLLPARLDRREDYLADSETEFADSVLCRLPKPLIALNVGASTLYKRWPRPHWIEAARALTAAGFGLALLAGPSETDDSSAVEEALNMPEHIINLGGRTTLRGLASVLARCDLLVTGDTGPMHLAAAVGTPTVALFGPTNPERTGPYGSAHAVLWKQIACSPCYRHPTCQGRVDCLRLITPGEVVEAVLNQISRLAPAPECV